MGYTFLFFVMFDVWHLASVIWGRGSRSSWGWELRFGREAMGWDLKWDDGVQLYAVRYDEAMCCKDGLCVVTV